MLVGTEIKGTLLVHAYDWQLKDDVYFVGKNGSFAMMWDSVITHRHLEDLLNWAFSPF